MQININLLELKEKVKALFYGILIFFFIYDISFTFLPTATTKIIVILLLLYFVFHFKLFSRYSHFLIIVFPFVLITILYSIITYLNGNFDYSFVRILFFIICQCFVGSYLMVLYLRKHNYYVLKLMAYVILFQAIIIIMCFVLPSFKEFLDSILPPLRDSYLNDRYRFRINGLSDSEGAGAALSAIQAFGVLIFMHLSKLRPDNKIKYLLFSIVIIAGNMVVGRTGMYFGIFFVTVYWLGFIFTSGLANLIKIITIAFFALFFLYLVIPADVKNIFEQLVIPWILDEDKSGQSGKTLGILKEMFFFPHGIYFLWGEGGWVYEGQGRNYIDSDIGYVRIIYAIGLIGLMFFYGTFLKMIDKLKKLYLDKNSKLFLNLILLFCIILELKEPFLMKGSFVRVIFLVYFSYRLNKISFKDEIKNNIVGKFDVFHFI